MKNMREGKKNRYFKYKCTNSFINLLSNIFLLFNFGICTISLEENCTPFGVRIRAKVTDRVGGGQFSKNNVVYFLLMPLIVKMFQLRPSRDDTRKNYVIHNMLR